MPFVMRTDRAVTGAGRITLDRESSPESALSSWDDEPMEAPAVTATPPAVERTATKRPRRAAKQRYASGLVVRAATSGRDATPVSDGESSPESAASADEDNRPVAKRLRGSTNKKMVPAPPRGKRRITTQTPTATKRRKTGLATAATVEQLDNDIDDENESDGDNDDSDSELTSLDDDSEYEAARRPTQRATWTHTRRPVARRGPRKVNQAQPTAPSALMQEVLFKCLLAICVYVTPADMLTLARTCQKLRRTLMAKASQSTWKSSSENTLVDDALPVFECPEGISEPAWAALLVEEKCSGACGRYGVDIIYWGILRRCCGTCKKDSMVWEGSFLKKFPEYPEELKDLVHCDKNSATQTAKKRYFWVADIEAAWGRYSVLTADAHMRKIGAQKRLDDFVKGAKDQIEVRHKAVPAIITWFREVHFSMTALGRRQLDIRARARAERMDVSLVAKMLRKTDDPVFTRPKRLKDTDWPVVKARLDAEILKNERQAVQARRRVVARNLYVDYLKTIPYNQWITHPSPEYVCNLDSVQRAITSPICTSDEDHTLFIHIVLELPRIVADWAQNRRSHLESLVENFYTSQNDDDVVIIPDISSVTFTCVKDSCFACGAQSSSWTRRSASHPFVGLERALQHHCSGRYSTTTLNDTTFQMRVHDSATSAVSALFEAIRKVLGLTFSQTTPLQLDVVDPRVVCLNCTARQEQDVYGRPAYSWRSAIEHHFDSHAMGIAPKWQVLTDEEATAVKAREGAPVIEQDWHCRHCAPHSGLRWSLPAVEKHLVQQHGIIDPDPTDYYSAPWGLQTVLKVLPVCFAMAKPPALPVKQNAPNKMYRCLHCAAGQKVAAAKREFILDGVRSHIRAVHEVSQTDSKEGTDFIAVDTPAAVHTIGIWLRQLKSNFLCSVIQPQSMSGLNGVFCDMEKFNFDMSFADLALTKIVSVVRQIRDLVGPIPQDDKYRWRERVQGLLDKWLKLEGAAGHKEASNLERPAQAGGTNEARREAGASPASGTAPTTPAGRTFTPASATGQPRPALPVPRRIIQTHRYTPSLPGRPLAPAPPAQVPKGDL